MILQTSETMSGLCFLLMLHS